MTGSTTGSNRAFEGGEVAINGVSDGFGEIVCGVGVGVGLAELDMTRIGTGRGSR